MCPFRRQFPAKRLLICTVSLLLMFGGFYANHWHVADQRRFLSHARGSESLVVGRLVRSRQEGIFSDGALLGAEIPGPDYRRWLTAEQIDHQYAAYLNGETFARYVPYMSQNGGQGIVLSWLDRVLPLPPAAKLESFHALTSLLSAVTLTLVTRWFYDEFGGWTAVVVMVSIVLSQWTTVFGRNLWWTLWACYLPMVAVMRSLRNSRASTNRAFAKLGILVFAAMLIKCLVNGYEYITTVLIMVTVPYVYYGILDRLTARQFLKGAVAALCGACIAVLMSLVILSFQIGSVQGSVLDGFEHIVYSWDKRTYGSAAQAGALRSTLAVITAYLKGTFLDLNNYLVTSNPVVSRLVFRVRYLYLLAAFAIMSVVAAWGRPGGSATQRQRKNNALVLTTWFSLLAPLSWYVIFRGHAIAHPHLDHIVWHMPFTLFGFAVCAVGIERAFALASNRLTSRLGTIGE